MPVDPQNPPVDPQNPPPADPPPSDPPKDPPPVDPPKPTNSGSAHYKAKIVEKDDKIAELTKRLDQKETDELKSKENYKGLYEIEKVKNEELSGTNKALKGTFLNGLMSSEIRAEALKAGIREDAINDLDLLDYSEIVDIETTSKGNANVTGAKEFVELQMKKRQHWFGESVPPKINNGGPADPPPPTEMTPADITKLEKTDLKKYKEVMAKKIADRQK